MSEFKSLCLSTAGVFAFNFVGALEFISDTIDITKIRRFVGTSAGAIICLFLAIGYTPLEIMLRGANNRAWQYYKHPNYMSTLQGDGAFLWNAFGEEIEKMVIDKLGKIPTLLQLLTDYNIDFTCVSYNLTKGQEVHLSAQTYPDLPCVLALRMTCSIPWIFPSPEYDNCLWSDGGVINPFPIDAAEDDEKMIAVCIVPRRSTIKDDSKEFNLLKYSLAVVRASSHQEYERRINKARELSNICLIEIPRPERESWDFNLGVADKLDLFSLGYDVAKKQFLSTNPQTTPDQNP